MTLPRRLAVLSLLLCACHPAEPAARQNPPPAQPAQPAAPAEKPKITKLDDLPRHTYPAQGSAVDLITSDEKFAAFAAAVRADIEKDLSGYDIADKTTLKRLKGTLLTLDLLEAKNDDARRLIAELRALEDKPALKLMTGFLSEVRLDVMDLQLKSVADLPSPRSRRPSARSWPPAPGRSRGAWCRTSLSRSRAASSWSAAISSSVRSRARSTR